MELKEYVRQNGVYLGGGYARNVYKVDNFAYKIQRVSPNRDYTISEYYFKDKQGEQQNKTEWEIYNKIKEKEAMYQIEFDLIPSIEYTEDMIKMELMDIIAEYDIEFNNWRDEKRLELCCLTMFEEYIQFCKEMKELKNQNLELQLGALNDLGVLHDIEYKPENFGYIDGYVKIIDLGYILR